ncbi:hypothetical protein CEXT_614381 [Caerostris extrusa]|uniref:Uncharacterized protein n=1 Tax=Caerostris extrusa TaxID=172846 RepID=A0AAV4NKJ1_CAEEX|nr:hypothetical protein CEXT_614381 [Caerostris extrusa]
MQGNKERATNCQWKKKVNGEDVPKAVMFEFQKVATPQAAEFDSHHFSTQLYFSPAKAADKKNIQKRPH